MGQGAQSKALRIANMTQYGFDATKIYKDNSLTEVDGDISNFDAEAGIRNRAGTGRLPQGVPDSFPDATDPKMGERVSFNAPDVSRENKDRGTEGADPYPGGGWQ